jgi:hypothetical protein
VLQEPFTGGDSPERVQRAGVSPRGLPCNSF